MKKIISVVMCLCLILSTFTFIVITASAHTQGYYSYKVSNGQATITACDTSISGKITIPLTLGGYPVTKIGDSAFENCSKLTSVSIGEKVTKIGELAFAYCTKLKSVTLGEKIKTLDVSAFDCCDALRNIYIDVDNSFYSDIDGVLFNKEKTVLIEYPAAKTKTNYEIPDSVITINEYAFSYCNSTTSITIPSSVTKIDGAFIHSRSFESVKVSEDNACFSAVDGVLFNKEKTVLLYYPVAKPDISYTIPDNVTNLGTHSFCDVKKIESIKMPDSLISIDDYSILRCYNLNSVKIGKNVESIGEGAFYMSGIKKIKFSKSVKTIGRYAFYLCGGLKSVKIEKGTTSIGESAFGCCMNLKIVTIPNSITKIEKNTFSSCTSLKTIKIPNSVKTIEEGAFYNCSNLKTIKIPNSVKTIEEGTFNGCSNLKTIKISNCVEVIKTNAFYDCIKLRTVTIPKSVKKIGSKAFGYYYDYTYHKIKRVSNFKIKGKKGTTAQKYANKNGFKFIKL